MQSSPRIEANRCAQRKTPKENVLSDEGQERRAFLQPHHPTLLTTRQLGTPMSSAPSPYSPNAVWSTGHYSRSSPTHPSQQNRGPQSTRATSAEEDEEESDENGETAEDAPEQNRLSQLKGLFLKDCTAILTRTDTFLTLILRAVREIIFGFGDDAPAPDTVALMEEILIEYLNEVVRK